jgi:hypothetical protein
VMAETHNYAFKPTAKETLRFNQLVLVGGGLIRRWAQITEDCHGQK